jgi:iron(III) transport system permease protein
MFPSVPRWKSLILPLLIALIIVLPLGGLVIRIFNPTVELWEKLWATTLPTMLMNTFVLMAGVGVGTFILGVGFAWLVTAYQFTGRAWFERLLLLPMALPAYVMGFVFMATFDYAGPVYTQWRAWFGKDAWFPEVRSAFGAIFVLTLVLYPYVYLLARAAFREQAASTVEAARMMGYTRTRAFFRLILPLARPSIVAGVVLAMMEAMTDYGTVRFFGYSTLSEGIVRVWEFRYDRQTATELAALLFFVALVMIGLERLLRGRARYYQQGGRGRILPRVKLHGWGNISASLACWILLACAFIMPVAQLVAWAIGEFDKPTVGAWKEVYGNYVGTSLSLAGVSALVVIILALIVAHGVRKTTSTSRRRIPRMIARLATLGYAMPGAVVAAGVLLFLSPLDHAVTDFAESLGRVDRSLLLTGTIVILIYAYVVRFMAVGFNSIDSSLEKVTPNMEQAARTLGARTRRVLLRVHLPLVSTGMLAGAILVFVDVMKELPVTLLLRPFGTDTLALWTYYLAAESFWKAAAIPALTILVVGLIPVFLLMRLGDRGNGTIRT